MNNLTVMSNKELRACAREQLKGVWGKMALAYLIEALIICAAMFIILI